MLNGIDTGNICVLNLLDMSAAFDTLDIPLSRLNVSFGISGTALAWFKSYLSERKQKVKINNFLSEGVKVHLGVPQGSVLGPVLFTLYTLPLSGIIKMSNIDYHSYADDNHTYKSVKVEEVKNQVNNSSKCISSVKEWMDRNKQKLNDTKTEYMLAGKASLLSICDKPPMNINGTEILPTSKVKNVGVIFDDELTMSDQISSLCQQMFGQIRKISLYRNYLTDDVVIQLMVSLVLSRMDYCNSLLTGLPDYLITKLQRVQNCAAKICFRKRKSDHVTPLLKALHWLPVKERIEYKIATLCHKHFHGKLPSYLSSLLKRPLNTRSLRSSDDQTILYKPIKNMKTYGERSFEFYAPLTWNSLPREIRELDSHATFKKRLKTHLFLKAFD